MKEVLSKIKQRRLSIIEFMDAANERVPASVLTHEFGLSLRVLREDMVALNRTFPFLELEEADYNFTLSYREETDISEVYRQIFVGEKVFQLIEEIVYRPGPDDQVLARRLDTSTSTLYRRIQALNPLLRKVFDIEVRPNPYRFVGQEAHIRNFLVQYSNERYRVDEWAIESLDPVFFEEFMDFLVGAGHLARNYSHYRYLKLCLLTNVLRMSQGHFLEDFQAKTGAEELYQRILRLDSRGYCQKFLASFGLEVNQQNFYDLLGQVLYQDNYWSKEEFKEARSRDPELHRRAIFIEEGLGKLEKILKVDFQGVDQLVYTAYQIASPINPFDTELDVYYIFRDTKKDFIRHLSLYFPNFYEKAKETFLTYSRKAGLVRRNYMPLVHHFIYKLLVLQPQILRKLEIKMEPVRVLLVAAADEDYANFVKDYLEKNFIHLRVDVYRRVRIDSQVINGGHYDIIMSQVLLPGVRARVIPLAWKVLPIKQEALLAAYKEVLEERAQNRAGLDPYLKEGL